ncbi:MAG: GNAT family N-acetyltransferase [Ruminococcus sp.]|nr:GNAT family N-acetyltransferase [Ruminococcus sp.]MCM1381539.1 GNAT family N-acetyltransferase [Muribaculaceae bacterium]MCM1478789.1 GNAT family N-acetyltransferase [Muribaculaceae bacterium]
MTFKNEITAAAAAQLARDYCCSPEDFLAAGNKVTLARNAEGQRRFKSEPSFFKAAAMGGGAVISAASEMLEFSAQLAAKYDGIRLFDEKQKWLINRKLAEFNKAIALNSIFYLPATPYRYAPRDGYHFKYYEEEEIVRELYPLKGFDNALMYSAANPRHDVLAVCAANGGRIVGMAGASNDSPRFWQIGIDVIPEYRNMGLGSELVAALTQAVFMRGAIPYYSTWSGNIASQNTARRAGYYPVWTEIDAWDIE